MNAKKLLSLLLAVMMVFCLSASAMADDPDVPANYTQTITAPSNGHAYEIYQIFTGDLKDGVLSNVKWGKNGTGTEGEAVDASVLTALQDANTSTATDVSKLTEILKNVSINSENKFGVVGGKTGDVANPTSVKAPIGYYLFKDIGPATDGEELGLHAVQLVSNITIKAKVGETTSQKKVKDINDSTDTQQSAWKDTADHDVNDVIDFQLSATITKEYENYTSYKLAFHDVQSEGLTFKEIKRVYYKNSAAGSQEVTISLDATNGYQLNTSPNHTNAEGKKCTFEVTIDDLKKAAPGLEAGATVYVEYTSTLNDQAKIGTAGNPNEMYVSYSNNPNGEGEGTTSEDKVVVFTLKAVVNKVEPNSKYDPAKDANKDGVNDDDGETQYIPLTGAQFELYKFKPNSNGSAVDTAGNKGDWVKVDITPTIEDVKVNDTTTIEDAKFTFSRIDDGYYKLVETVTPGGYNTAADKFFTISADHTDDPIQLALSSVTVDGDFSKINDESGAEIQLLNQKGTELPETGGMGTTLLYVGGVALVAAAAILLIFKKRMSVEK